MRILLILGEVCDQELAPVARLGRAQALHCALTLPAVAHLEEATVRADARSPYLRVRDEVHRVINAIVPAQVPVGPAAIDDAKACLRDPGLLISLILLILLVQSSHSFFSEQHILRVEAEGAPPDFVFIDSEARAGLVLGWHSSFVLVHLLPQREEVLWLANTAGNVIRGGQLHVR